MPFYDSIIGTVNPWTGAFPHFFPSQLSFISSVLVGWLVNPSGETRASLSKPPVRAQPAGKGFPASYCTASLCWTKPNQRGAVSFMPSRSSSQCLLENGHQVAMAIYQACVGNALLWTMFVRTFWTVLPLLLLLLDPALITRMRKRVGVYGRVRYFP